MIIHSAVITGLFLVPLWVLGACAIYTDIRYGKIKNVHLLYGFAYAVCLYIFLTMYSILIINQPGNIKYFLELIVNGCMALACGYLLWHFDLWAAGDAKLFFLFALLIPLEFYSRSYIPLFPSATLLIDAFLFICGAFILEMLWKTAAFIFNFCRDVFRREKAAFSIRVPAIPREAIRIFLVNTGKLFVICTSSLVILQYVSTMIARVIPSGFSPNPLFLYTLFFIVQIIAFRTLIRNKWCVMAILIGGIACSVAFLASHNAAALFSTVKTSILFLLFVGAGMQLVYAYIDRHEVRGIKIIHLLAGSFLTPESLIYIESRLKETNRAGALGACCSDGLTEPQVLLIQEAFQEDKEAGLSVYKTFFFAPFIFAAFIFAVFMKESLLFFLLRL